MNPDGMSYLDVGTSFFRHDWANAINAWWSPLYPWAIGAVLGIFNPSPRWEFPLVHLVNFAIFAIAMGTFEAFLRALLRWQRGLSTTGAAGETEVVPECALRCCAYAIFWWIALEVETVYDVAPDLAVAACFFATCALLLRLKEKDQLWKFVLFGLCLSVGYWTKAVLFPLGFVVLAAAYWWKRSQPHWRKGIVVAAVTFVVACSPLIFLLSKQKGRFTFGDSGRGNYAWTMFQEIQHRNWQGLEPGSGPPVHPTRQLLEHPPVYEFDGPVGGTYPPRTDPSYWNEGLHARFQIRSEIRVLLVNIPSEIRLLTREQPGLLVGIVALALLGGYSWWKNLRRVWPLAAISLAGMAAYVPLVENDRYLGGFVAVLFLLLLWAGPAGTSNKKAVLCILAAVFVSMALSTGDYTVRVLSGHYAIPGVAPNSRWQDVVAAEELWGMGLRPGDKVAIVGDGTSAYWARLARLRIVAEIMEAKHATVDFWKSSPQTQAQVYTAFQRAHAVKAVATCFSGCPAEIPPGWQQIAGTPYWIRSLSDVPSLRTVK
ncbi:MAG TPA: hypothetical protein VGG04_02330 [Candidatus Sulfotelmatobacter sp.]